MSVRETSYDRARPCSRPLITYLAWRRLGEIEAVDAYARRVVVTTATSWWRRRWHGEQPSDVLPERAVDPHDGWADREARTASRCRSPARPRM